MTSRRAAEATGHLVHKLNEWHGRARPGDPSWMPASSRSSWLTACNRRRRTRSTSTASRWRRELYGPGIAGPATAHRPAADRARGAVRPGLERRRPAVGQPRRARSQAPQAGRRVGPADCRVPRRPEGSRPVRRDAGHVGRRVRPHAGRRTAGPERPRSQPLRLLDVAGRRRRQGRAGRSGRPTSSASPRSRTRSTSTTSTRRSCTCWASTTRS